MNHHGLHHFGKLCSPKWAGASLPEIASQDILPMTSIEINGPLKKCSIFVAEVRRPCVAGDSPATNSQNVQPAEFGDESLRTYRAFEYDFLPMMNVTVAAFGKMSQRQSYPARDNDNRCIFTKGT
jgi:hypothetical protein